MGDEWPSPGTVIFHLTFSVFDQVSTYPAPSTLPCPDGPRQRVQYIAPSPVTGIVRTLSSVGVGAAGCAARLAQQTRRAIALSRMCLILSGTEGTAFRPCRAAWAKAHALRTIGESYL